MKYMSYKRKSNPFSIVSINMPIALLDKIENVVEQGYFKNRSELIRFAVIKFLIDFESKIRSLDIQNEIQKLALSELDLLTEW